MGNWYTNRDAVKDALGIPATATGDHDQIDTAIEAVSRLIDDYCGMPMFPRQATRYLETSDADCLYLDEPLRAVATLKTDLNGDGTYETTWTTSDYWLEPANATAGSPPRPYWRVETRMTGAQAFPTDQRRGIEIAGTWGYFDETRLTTATLATAANSTVGTLGLNGATSVHPGQTLKIGSEQIYVREVDVTASSIAVDRAVNGSSGAAYSSGQALSIYEYPILGQAALYQAGQDFRSAGMPMGVAGGEPFGVQTMRAQGGLHPFVRRMLEPFRKPVTA